MLPDTFGFLDKVLIKLRSHFGRSFEHNIRLALAGEVAKVKSFPGHLNFGDVSHNTPRYVDSQIAARTQNTTHKTTVYAPQVNRN
jgi:hypothetical protein